jgi:hypothetical protein
VGGNVVKRRLVIVFDRFLERADVLGTLDLDREDVAGIVAKYNAVDVEFTMIIA